VGFSSHPAPRFHTNNVSVPEQGDDAAVRQIVQANSAPPHFVGAAITSAKGKELVESPPTVSRKQLAAESDSDLMITFTRSDDDDHEKEDTSSDDDEHEKEEEYSETDIGIFGPDYSSSDNDITKHDDDDIESSDHDDQEEAQALTAYDELISAASVMNDMLDAEQMQQMQQERLKADEALKNTIQGLFDFSKELVLSNTHNDYLVQLQAIMKERFDRLDFEPAHELQIIAYANRRRAADDRLCQ
jgi:hypothetical protein